MKYSQLTTKEKRIIEDNNFLISNLGNEVYIRPADIKYAYIWSSEMNSFDDIIELMTRFKLTRFWKSDINLQD